MSVLGVGLDVVDVASFARQLDDVASGFVAATFTAGERRASEGEPARRAEHLAARFAAKEALVKAWSSGRAGLPPSLDVLDLRAIEVTTDGWGRPALLLHDPVAPALRALGGGEVRIHLSLSHDGPVAAAMVVLESER